MCRAVFYHQPYHSYLPIYICYCAHCAAQKYLKICSNDSLFLCFQNKLAVPSSTKTINENHYHQYIYKVLKSLCIFASFFKLRWKHFKIKGLVALRWTIFIYLTFQCKCNLTNWMVWAYWICLRASSTYQWIQFHARRELTQTTKNFTYSD